MTSTLEHGWNMTTFYLLRKSPSPHCIVDEIRPAVVTEPIFLGPLRVFVAPVTKYFMEESRPVTLQGLYERLLHQVEGKVSCY